MQTTRMTSEPWSPRSRASSSPSCSHAEAGATLCFGVPAERARPGHPRRGTGPWRDRRPVPGRAGRGQNERRRCRSAGSGSKRSSTTRRPSSVPLGRRPVRPGSRPTPLGGCPSRGRAFVASGPGPARAARARRARTDQSRTGRGPLWSGATQLRRRMPTAARCRTAGWFPVASSGASPRSARLLPGSC